MAESAIRPCLPPCKLTLVCPLSMVTSFDGTGASPHSSPGFVQVALKAHLWSGLAMVITLLAQVLIAALFLSLIPLLQQLVYLSVAYSRHKAAALSACSDAVRALNVAYASLQDGTGFPSAGYLTVFLMLGVGLPALLQTLRASPGVL